jgi:hypothetical protein
MEDIKSNAMAQLRKIPAGASSNRRIDGEGGRKREGEILYTWMPLAGKTHNQIGHSLIDKRRLVLDVRSFRAAHCDTDHYLVVAKVRERLAVNKQNHTDFIWRVSISIN